MRVLVACEFSGTVRRAFRALGHDAWSCDLLPAEDGSEHHFQCNVLSLWRWQEPFDLLIAHPPCTRLTNSGVRWLKVPPPGKTLEQMWADLDAACAFYKALREAPMPFKALENPVMHCYARERLGAVKRQVVQPHYFGDPFFKATGFELVGLPPLNRTHHMAIPRKGTPEHKKWSAVHMASPGPDRWKERSRTFPGIAGAMAEQWGAFVQSQLAEVLAEAA
jgi:hypothetical protein